MARFLVVGPHPDDQELGMGGTIAALARAGHDVHLLDVTDGEPTPRGSPEIRAAEAKSAAEVLGVQRLPLELADGGRLRNREVVPSVEARHAMAAVYRDIRPDIVFLPYPEDAHPDHIAVTRIGEDARFDAKLTRSRIPGDPWHPRRIFHYFCTHLRLAIQPTFCIDISETFDLKSRAIACYASQFQPDGVPRMVRDVNAYFGTRIGTTYAEPFWSREVLGLSGLGDIL